MSLPVHLPITTRPPSLAVMEDLSSCGDCPLRGGQDCNLLPGIAFGGVTCDRGSCVAHGCLEEEGYELSGPSCLLRGSQPNITTSPSTTLTAIPSTTPNNRYSLAPRSPSLHISHRSQARIDPNTIVTIYLQYSGIDLSSNTGDAGGGARMMDSSAEGTNSRAILERIRKMGNVRIVEAEGT